MAVVLTVAALWSAPALAVEHTVVRWKKTGQCEIVTRLPMWGDHWVVLGGYDSKAQAELALSKLRRTKACPASKAAKRADKPPEQRKPPITAKPNRPMDMLW
ncbi:MAG: hypothetical protein ACM3Q1_05325 [Bacteroidales bacterium]